MDQVTVSRSIGMGRRALADLFWDIGAWQRIWNPIEEVVVTNSVPVPPENQGPPLTILSVAPLLAEAIVRVHENRSVSELFR